MSNHLGDTNKMVDTPRTYLQDRLLSMVHAFHDDQRKYAVRLLANDVADLEHKLNAANDRIKRLEEALGLVLKMRNDWLENQEDGYEGAYYAFVKGNDSEWEEIIKAKEAKL